VTTQEMEQPLMTQPGPDDAGAGVSANPVNAASPASG
jgi:hypothetical protein